MKRKILLLIIIFIIFTLVYKAVNYKNQRYSIAGRDTRLYVYYGKYQVYNEFGNMGDSLCYFDDKKNGTLMREVYSFDSDFRNVYVVSREGYAIINKKSGYCRILLKCNVEDWKNHKVILEDGSSFSVIGKEVLGNDIELISSFEEFSEKEQKKLLKLSNK